MKIRPMYGTQYHFHFPSVGTELNKTEKALGRVINGNMILLNRVV